MSRSQECEQRRRRDVSRRDRFAGASGRESIESDQFNHRRPRQDTARAPVTSTERHPDPDAPRVRVTISDIRTRDKGFIFGRTDEQQEVFLHESAFDSETHFVTRLVGDVVTVLLVHSKKGFRGHAVQVVLADGTADVDGNR